MHLNKQFEASVNARIDKKNILVDEENGDLIIEGFANTVTKDRAGDVIPASAWSAAALDNYYKNPIILAFHNHSMPIGSAIELEAREMGLYVKARISKGAGNVYALIKDGVLSTFSVGFMIKDADYDSVTDTYFITDVELFEISVVSVPCNQDSTFSVAKSIEDSTEYENFKKNFISIKEENNMPQEFNAEQFKADLLGQVSKTVKDTLDNENATKAEQEAAQAKAEAERKAHEEATKSTARKEAEEIIKGLREELDAKDGNFAEAVSKQEETILQLKEEIAQVVQLNRGAPVSRAVKAGLKPGASEQEVDNLVMLGMIKRKGMFDTEYGKTYAKAVNASSSIQVSSDAYETEFSTNLMRDIQAELVFAPLFTEITMNAANLTIPINPDRKNATWVDSTGYGTPTSSGNELSVALTEKTLRTFKLAAKVYLTDETDEDVIIAMVPILRQHLVEAHANEIDRAFLLGTGTGQPKGLATQAEAIGADAIQVTTAKADGSVKVTAKELLKGRRKLKLYGIKRSDLALVISQDAYWDLLEDNEWADVQQVNNSAVKLVGEVGNIYGMPVIVSNQFVDKVAEGVFAVMVNKTNFMVARQRGATVKTDFDVERDRRVFVATQRLNLEPMIEVSAGNGKGVVAYKYAAAGI